MKPVIRDVIIPPLCLSHLVKVGNIKAISFVRISEAVWL